MLGHLSWNDTYFYNVGFILNKTDRVRYNYNDKLSEVWNNIEKRGGGVTKSV